MGLGDAFGKDSQDETLQYDDAAFLYFAITALSCMIVPLGYSVFMRAVFPSARFDSRNFRKLTHEGKKIRYCTCKSMVDKAERQRRQFTKWSTILDRPFWVRAVILAMLVTGWINTFNGLSTATEVKTFDPFEILGVEKDATDKEIKKAYRMQSLVYHPDKNPDDPDAQAVFIKITKAYSALTDPKAKEMYEKYGNPDGAQTMRTGIGLPRFMLESENKIPILVLFGVVLLLAIPALGMLHYINTRHYAANGVLLDSLQLLGQKIGDGPNLQKCPELIGACCENLLLPFQEGKDMDALEDLAGKLNMWDPEPTWDFELVSRNHILMLAHLQRKQDLIPERLRPVLDQMLGHSSKLTQSMLEIATLQLWKKRTAEMLEFRRCILQQLDMGASPLLQIPGFDAALVEKCNKGGCTELKQFMNMTNAERKDVTGWAIESEQMIEANEYVNHLPKIELDFEVWVDDEEEVCKGDIVTVKIKMNRTNLKDDESAGPIYTPHYPEPVFEEWWFLISVNDNPKWTLVEKARSQDKETVKTCYVQLSTPGTHAFTVRAVCDTYVGLDVEKTQEITAKDVDECAREIILHKEDEDLDKLPTLFESMMGLGPEEEESDDSDFEDDKKKKPEEKREFVKNGQKIKIIGESAPEPKDDDASSSDVSSVSSDSDDSDSD